MMPSKIFNPRLLLAFGVLICASSFLPTIDAGGKEKTCSAAGGTCEAKEDLLEYGMVACQYTESNSGTKLDDSLVKYVKPLIKMIKENKFYNAEAKHVWCPSDEQRCRQTDDTNGNSARIDFSVMNENKNKYSKENSKLAEWKGYNCKGKDAGEKDATKCTGKLTYDEFQSIVARRDAYEEETGKWSSLREKKDQDFRNTKAFKDHYLACGENNLDYLSIENSLDRKCTDVVHVTEPFPAGPNGKWGHRVAYVFRTKTNDCPDLVPGTAAHYSYEIRLAYHKDGMTHEHIVVVIPRATLGCENNGTCEHLRKVRRFLNQRKGLAEPIPSPDWLTKEDFISRDRIEEIMCAPDTEDILYCLPSAKTFRAVTTDAIRGRFTETPTTKPNPIPKLQ